MMIQRLKTRRESWFWVLKILYILLAFPCLVFLTLASLFTLGDVLNNRDFHQMFFYAIIWFSLLVPVGVFFYKVFSKRRLLKIITNDIKHPDFFMPEPGYEMFHEGDGKYLGGHVSNMLIFKKYTE